MLAVQEKHEYDFRHDFHRRRDPFASPFWRIVDAHYDTFERAYPERYVPKYGFLRIVAFIERRTQADVIEKILRHCGLWVEPGPRAPPKFALAADLDPEYIPTLSNAKSACGRKFLANF